MERPADKASQAIAANKQIPEHLTKFLIIQLTD